MTLCIAGVCRHDGLPAVVIVADTQGTDNLAKSYDTYKVAELRDLHTAVAFCDLRSAAIELTIELKPIVARHLSPDSDDRAVTALMADIRTHTAEKSKALAHDHMLRTYGSTPTEFYGWAKKRELAEIRALSLRCELLLCHASKSTASIIWVGDKGQCSWQDQYVGIGSGWALARAFLSQEDWDEDRTLMDCARRLLAAKIFAERDAYVGQKTTIHFVVPGKHIQRFTDSGLKRVYEGRPIIAFQPSEPALDADMEDGS